MSSSFVECYVYGAPSSSGGKVWGYPVADTIIRKTFFGPANRFNSQNSVSIRDVKSKGVSTALQEKMSKGYSKYANNVWVNFNTGDVLMSDPNQTSSTPELKRETNVTPPDSVITIKTDGAYNF